MRNSCACGGGVGDAAEASASSSSSRQAAAAAAGDATAGAADEDQYPGPAAVAAVAGRTQVPGTGRPPSLTGRPPSATATPMDVADGSGSSTMANNADGSMPHHGPADFVLCIGDDRSDEDMFLAIEQHVNTPQQPAEVRGWGAM